MGKRLFLLPGFGEDERCFDELEQLISGYEKIHIDYRPVLNKFIFPLITVQQFARQLIKHYGIHPGDKLVGHSMGGFFSFQIRELIGCDICLIGSFSDPEKVFHTVPQVPRITQIAALTGIIKTAALKKYLLGKIKNEHIKNVQAGVMDNFHTFTNTQLALMSEMIYAPKIPSKLPNPLRIHDKRDRIVRPPDEPYIQMEGGHFCLNLYPQETLNSMKHFLYESYL